MHEDYEYVKSLEKEVDELESEKADFSNIYDLLLEECSNDMVHNYYLEKAKKSAQLQKDKEVNGKPSMIDPARLPNTANGLVLDQMTSDHNRSELRIHNHSNEPSSSKLVPKVVPLAVKTATS
ncbi:hypothetical protein Tco_0185918 [Tanacetum coccineum]